MSATELLSKILAFAHHLDPSESDPHAKAARRAWVDEAGAPTQAGAELVRALTGQAGTRSVFRVIH